MDYPLVFSGSAQTSLFIVNDELVGWGHPSASYFFQMWRDLPSHVIHYRDMVNAEFLPGFGDDPVERPEESSFRYDYLIKGNVPQGSWIQFNAGVSEDNQGFLSKIRYKKYSPELNNLETNMIHKEVMTLEIDDFLLLLTNLGSSTGLDDVIDESTKNVLIDDSDKARRLFNERFYRIYFDFITKRIKSNLDFVSYLLSLSGIQVLAYLVRRDDELKKTLLDDKSWSENVSHPITYSFLVESGFYLIDDFSDDFEKYKQEMEDFHVRENEFFMNRK